MRLLGTLNKFILILDFKITFSIHTVDSNLEPFIYSIILRNVCLKKQKITNIHEDDGFVRSIRINLMQLFEYMCERERKAAKILCSSVVC